MKNNFRFYLYAWLFFVALFNLISFTLGLETRTNFWICYACSTISMIIQLSCAYYVFKDGNKNKIFLNIPVITVSFIGMIVSIIVGILAMIVPIIPTNIVIVIYLLIISLMLLSIVKATAAATLVNNIDNKIKEQTSFIKEITLDIEILLNNIDDIKTKELCKNLYEKVKYSDPMSNKELFEIEKEINNKYIDFKNSILDSNFELSEKMCRELLLLIDKRNNKCKGMK